MISSSLKRFCKSSIKKCQWSPIISDEYLHLPDVQSMIVARIKDRRLTSEILDFIDEIYPWENSLKHIRRIYNSEIILYPSEFSQPISNDLFEKYFDEQIREINVPKTPCLVKWQYERCIEQFWPSLVFRENKLLEQTISKKKLNENDEIILDLLHKIQDNDEESHCAIIIDNDGQIPLVGSRDYRQDHPLQHSTIVAIDYLSKNSFYHRENLLEKFIEKSEKKKAYLLNGCSIYLTHEPCIMCAMALLHSRISTVYYVKSNQQFGALGSIYKLNTLKKTNHRFLVYQLEDLSIDEINQ
ncbi:unnamed protein product [Adineta ricciae]|uniref:CMP/dCMP-type deaminase domain-containing protein n=1 Tax=Adineta ricciae TaxID=249248 RepID=A0A815LDL5_ADIRI|nr:unnamed protein product [Adineta ricciae]CAF1408488.1 unnamed protein product [Adineta ricciae]